MHSKQTNNKENILNLTVQYLEKYSSRAAQLGSFVQPEGLSVCRGLNIRI